MIARKSLRSCGQCGPSTGDREPTYRNGPSRRRVLPDKDEGAVGIGTVWRGAGSVFKSRFQTARPGWNEPDSGFSAVGGADSPTFRRSRPLAAISPNDTAEIRAKDGPHSSDSVGRLRTFGRAAQPSETPTPTDALFRANGGDANAAGMARAHNLLMKRRRYPAKRTKYADEKTGYCNGIWRRGQDAASPGDCGSPAARVSRPRLLCRNGGYS